MINNVLHILFEKNRLNLLMQRMHISLWLHVKLDTYYKTITLYARLISKLSLLFGYIFGSDATRVN